MRAVALTFAMLGAAACAAPGDPPLVVECAIPSSNPRPGAALVGQPYGMQHSPLPLNSVQFDSPGTASRVAVQSLYASRTATDTVQVGARLVNCSSLPGAVRMRSSFFKPDQAPAEPTSAWKVVHLQPRAISHYEELSTSRGASSYLIEIAAE
jgi:hypothetical protein